MDNLDSKKVHNLQSDLYASYAHFKGWSPGHRRLEWQFEELFNGIALGPGLVYLEIGFGQGELMDWMRARGLQTSGLEIIQELAVEAAERGHRVFGTMKEVPGGSVDIIAAIDVLEHLTMQECRTFLENAYSALRLGGTLLVRFPNGMSPFVGPYQYGDATHQIMLTEESLRQIASPCGFNVLFARNPRPKRKGLTGVKQIAAYFFRDIIEISISYLYFGTRLRLDPNIIVALVK